MTDVLIDRPAPATGNACFERPQHAGRQHVNFDDFDDTWMQRYLTDGTNPLAGGTLILPGDVFEFDIKIPAPVLTDPADQYGWPDITDLGASRPIGIDLKFIGGPYLSDYNLVDANGIAVANADRHVTAYQTWYHVSASLADYAGLYLRAAILTDEGEPEATRRVIYYSQVVITSGGAVRVALWNGTQITPGPTPSNHWSFGGGENSFSLLDVGIEGPIVVFGTLTADGLIGPYTSAPVRIVTAGTTDTVSAFDSTVVYNVSGTMTVALPSALALTVGREFEFKNIHATGTVVLDPSGAQTIDGASTYSLSTQWSRVRLHVYSGNWITI